MVLQPAYFRNLVTNEVIPVQFNPTELHFSKNAKFADIDIPGLDAPMLQFIRGDRETLTVELFFDTTDQGMGENAVSVTLFTDRFYNLVKQNPNTHAPPKCLFTWGPAAVQVTAALVNQSRVSQAPFWFTCIVESVDRKFLLFSPEGVPLRARLTVKLVEYQTLEQMIAPLKSADHTKTRVLKRQERLDQIAAHEYETAAAWRQIAEANDLENPLQIRPGTILKIPPIQVGSEVQRTDS